jgi:hypothetical protein
MRSGAEFLHGCRKKILTTNLTYMLKLLQPHFNHEGAFLNVFLLTSS